MLINLDPTRKENEGNNCSPLPGISLSASLWLRGPSRRRRILHCALVQGHGPLHQRKGQHHLEGRPFQVRLVEHGIRQENDGCPTGAYGTCHRQLARNDTRDWRSIARGVRLPNELAQMSNPPRDQVKCRDFFFLWFSLCVLFSHFIGCIFSLSHCLLIVFLLSF